MAESGRCEHCWLRDRSVTVRPKAPEACAEAGWATWFLAREAGIRAGEGLWVCPSCWFEEDYELMVARLGKPRDVRANHPGPLPAEVQGLCIPQGMEWIRTYESFEDMVERRFSDDPTRATRSLWGEPELATLKDSMVRKQMRRQSAVLKAVGVGSGAVRQTTVDVARSFPGITVERELGRGAFSTVFAVQRDDGQRCALKVLAPQLFAEPVLRRRFEQEAEILERLDHPSIVGVYESLELTGQLCFLLELVDGGASLRRLIDAGALEPRRALSIAEDICAGLEHAHSKGVIHRDIKPDNILLDREGAVKIADFGIAKVVQDSMAGDALTVAGDVLGTPTYMAPEQVGDALSASAASDIYSVGVTLYEMITGRKPVSGKGVKGFVFEGVSPRVRRIVERACAVEVGDRYSGAGLMREALVAARLGL